MVAYKLIKEGRTALHQRQDHQREQGKKVGLLLEDRIGIFRVTRWRMRKEVSRCSFYINLSSKLFVHLQQYLFDFLLSFDSYTSVDKGAYDYLRLLNRQDDHGGCSNLTPRQAESSMGCSHTNHHHDGTGDSCGDLATCRAMQICQGNRIR